MPLSQQRLLLEILILPETDQDQDQEPEQECVIVAPMSCAMRS
jgi:hypothetical protein